MDRIEIKADLTVDEAGVIEGIAWPFAAGPDSIGDLIDRGAFTVKQMPLPMLDAHNPEAPIGVWDEVAETADALRVKGRLLVDDVQRAREVRALIRAKAITGLSIGYRTTKSAPRKGGGRTISRLDLYEVSPVAFPSHPAARITAAKSADADATREAALAEETNGAAADLAEMETKMGEIAETVKGLGKLADRLDKLEARVARPSGKADDPDEAKALERKAFGSYLRLGNQVPADELKALTVSSDPQAGYLAPTEMSTEFVRDLVEFSPVRSVASVRATGAPSVKYPRRTSITNAQWEGELEESEESSVGFGMIELPIWKMMTFVDISNELLADSAGQAEAEVRLALAEDFGKKEATAFVAGSGVKMPEGFMSNAEIDHTVNGHATNLSTDKLIELLYAMPAAYRNAPGARWVMNGTTLAAVRKLKNGTTGEYLWQPALVAGQPESLLGKPVMEMVDMPDIGDGNFPILFGDFSAYRVVDRLALSILSDPYTQARKGVTRIHATRRVGGRVLQPARFRKLKTATA